MHVSDLLSLYSRVSDKGRIVHFLIQRYLFIPCHPQCGDSGKHIAMRGGGEVDVWSMKYGSGVPT